MNGFLQDLQPNALKLWAGSDGVELEQSTDLTNDASG